jgi:hypothetical protein
MGAEDIIRLVLDNPGLDTALSTCFTAWLATRKSRRLKIILRANDTAEIEADGINTITTDDVIRALNAARGKPDDAAAG